MNVELLLENRHSVHLSWREQWKACGPEGNDLPAQVVVTATVRDCINLIRYNCREGGMPTAGDDADFLRDFMLAHSAFVLEQAVLSMGETGHD